MFSYVEMAIDAEHIRRKEKVPAGYKIVSVRKIRE